MEDGPVTLHVYLDDGRVFSEKIEPFHVETRVKYIATIGYGTAERGAYEHWPPHRVNKIKVGEEGTPTPS